MLSIRQRRGAHAYPKELAFGRPAEGWPGWGELGPILLRSAGIVGLAGVIMVIAAGDALFKQPLRAPRPEAVQPAVEPTAQPTIQQVAVRPGTILPAEAVVPPPSEPPKVEQASASAAPPVADAPDPTPQPSRVAEEKHPSALAVAPVAEIVEPPQPPAGEEQVRAFDPLAYAPGPTMPFVKTAMAELTGPAGPALGFTPAPAALPALDAEDDETLQDAALTASTGKSDAVGAASPTDRSAAADVTALAPAEPAENVAPVGRATAPRADGSLWEEEAVACPRLWLEGDAALAEGSVDCEPVIALAPDTPGEVDEELEAASPLDEALESAAATHAMKLTGFVARAPLPRPEPPPVRRVRSRGNSDWPAAPPPDCGKLHAYWHFVDRKTHTKEWYCR